MNNWAPTGGDVSWHTYSDVLQNGKIENNKVRAFKLPH